jgi:uncharacterized protein YdeI (YjbR/CyaY-like superfamily)
MGWLEPNHFFIEKREELREFLIQNTQEQGLWLVTNKKTSQGGYVSYDEVVKELLCFGWIDSKTGFYDEGRSKLWIAPRKPKSNWSAPNKARVEKLISAGLMTEAGMRLVELARAGGQWNALDGVEALLVPDDLAAEFLLFPPAAENFDAFPRSVKRGILEWILTAKKPETRAARIRKTAEMAQRNERANQWSK